MMKKVNLADKLAQFSDYWNPRIVGELNGQHVKLAKFSGEFVWHHHDHEDELFYVISGQLKMWFREETSDGDGGDRLMVLNPGEVVIVPKGVEHKPVADEEVHVMLLEPTSTLNTGNVRNALTQEYLQAL